MKDLSGQQIAFDHLPNWEILIKTKPHRKSPFCKIIPEHTLGAIHRYIYQGIQPGGFLTALIENNLSRAIQAADKPNLAAIAWTTTFFMAHVPVVTRDIEEWVEFHHSKNQEKGC